MKKSKIRWNYIIYGIAAMLILIGVLAYLRDTSFQKYEEEQIKIREAEKTRIANEIANENAKEKESQSFQEYTKNLPKCQFAIRSKPIYSLERSSEVVGSITSTSETHYIFALGYGLIGSYEQLTGISGEISSRMIYYFYTSDGRGSYVLDGELGTTPIYENNNISPRVAWIEYTGEAPLNGESLVANCKGIEIKDEDNLSERGLFNSLNLNDKIDGIAYKKENFNEENLMEVCSGDKSCKEALERQIYVKCHFIYKDGSISEQRNFRDCTFPINRTELDRRIIIVPQGSIKKEIRPN